MQQRGQSKIRILIVDDHPVVRAGLTSMLTTQPGLQVVGSASSGEEAFAKLAELAPDVILLDLRMPGMDGLNFLRLLRGREAAPKAIVITSFETDEDIYRAVQAGARGYLLKSSQQQEIVDAIGSVHAGMRHIPPRIAARLADRMTRSNLTPRELEILEMLARGLTNKQIGLALGISENTARNHVNSIIEKLDVSDRTEAATAAIEQGIIRTGTA